MLLTFRYCEFQSRNFFKVFTVLFLLLTLSGCVQSIHKGEHAELSASLSEERIKKVLVVPSDIQIYELGVVSTEEVPKWTDAGKELVDKVVKEKFDAYSKFELVDDVPLTNEEKYLLDQHTELYYPVVFSEIDRIRHEAWKADKESTKTTVGPGLSFIKEKYGIDYVIFASGEDYISTDGRKAAAVLAAFAGIGIQMGYSFLSVGVVETQTGNVLWNNIVISQEVGFLDYAEVDTAVSKNLETFPAEEAGQKLSQEVAEK